MSLLYKRPQRWRTIDAYTRRHGLMLNSTTTANKQFVHLSILYKRPQRWRTIDSYTRRHGLKLYSTTKANKQSVHPSILYKRHQRWRPIDAIPCNAQQAVANNRFVHLSHLYKRRQRWRSIDAYALQKHDNYSTQSICSPVTPVQATSTKAFHRRLRDGYADIPPLAHVCAPA
jgi:hypothetical protein